MTRERGALWRAASALWRGVDRARRLTVNLLFLAFLLALVVWLAGDRTPGVERGSALVVAPSGLLVEELSGDPGGRAIQEALGRQAPEVLMKRLLRAIDAARDDERIAALYLDLDGLAGGGLSKLQRLHTAIARFRDAGKPVIASGDFYTQAQYHLAAAADEVYLHPMGMVLVTGYGSYRRYYREALDRLAVDWNVFRVGEYKSAVEPFLLDGMSAEAREARRQWLTALWSAYKEDVAAARGLEPSAIEDYADRIDSALAEHGGDAAELARSVGLVDGVWSRDQVRERMIELVGANGDGGSFRQVDYRAYHRAVGPPPARGDGTVAVVVASGAIVDGSQPPGVVGGDSTARRIRQAREDDDVEALVLRVDSPGGSAFASEIIRREVELAREAGKPVVASMSSVAASGGYWISMTADEIWANPTTITGSIGIYAMLPTVEESLARLGVRNDGVGTNPLAGALRFDRALPAEAEQALQLMIDRGYRDFVTKAAAGRGLSFDEIDQVARGRVWSGADAHRLGLVDHLGDLDDAVAAAAERAELGEEYRVEYVEERPSTTEQLIARLLSGVARAVAPAIGALVPERPRLPALSDLLDEVARLEQMEDPRRILAYCFCEAE